MQSYFIVCLFVCLCILAQWWIDVRPGNWARMFPFILSCVQEDAGKEAGLAQMAPAKHCVGATLQ